MGLLQIVVGADVGAEDEQPEEAVKAEAEAEGDGDGSPRSGDRKRLARLAAAPTRATPLLTLVGSVVVAVARLAAAGAGAAAGAVAAGGRR